jgi:hypothetical protein
LSSCGADGRRLTLTRQHRIIDRVQRRKLIKTISTRDNLMATVGPAEWCWNVADGNLQKPLLADLSGQSQPPPPGPGPRPGGSTFGWPSAGAGGWCGTVLGQARMHPQLRPIKQGLLGASAADVPGVRALCSTPPRAAPHPTIKTNRPALARSATSDLPTFVITSNCRRAGRPMRHKRAHSRRSPPQASNPTSLTARPGSESRPASHRRGRRRGVGRRSGSALQNLLP